MNHLINISFTYEGVRYSSNHQVVRLNEDNKPRSKDHEDDLKFSMYRRLTNVGALLPEHRGLDKCRACLLIENFQITIKI